MTEQTVRVVLVGKPDCHLCEAAEVVVREVCAQTGTAWESRSITTDPALADAYWEKIPVVLVDGVVRDFWRVDPVRLRAAIEGR